LATRAQRNGAGGDVLEPNAVVGQRGTTVTPLGLTPQAAQARLRRRFSLRVLGALLIMAVTVVLFVGIEVWATPATRAVVVAARDLPAGARLHRGDLRQAQVQLADAQAQAAIAAEALDSLEGRELAAPVFTDQVLVWKQVAAVDQPVLEPGFRAMAFAVTPATAVGGAIEAGDRVQVIATRNKGRPDAESQILLEAARVVNVGRGEAGPTDGIGPVATTPALPTERPAQPITTVTLAVPTELAVSLAQATAGADVEILLIPPGEESLSPPASNSAEPAAAAARP
jgi:Flp pilus assembly protein CpaB